MPPRTRAQANQDVDPDIDDPELDDETEDDDSDGKHAGEEPVQQYVVVHGGVNVWDSDFPVKEAKKDRITRRLLKGDIVDDGHLVHADTARLLRLGAIRPVNAPQNTAKSAPVAEDSGLTELPDVPEAQGAQVPQNS